MEYLLIFILEVLGIGLHVMQKVNALDKKFPEVDVKEIWKIFFNEDWTTLIISGLVMCFNIVAQFIFNYYEAPFIENDYYIFISFAVAFVLGYAGQRMIYNYLGSAENFINKKVSDKIS